MVGTVTRCEVCDLMRQYSGELALVVQVPQKPRSHVEKAPWHRERVELGRVDYLGGYRHIKIRIARNPVCYAVYIFVEILVLNNPAGPFQSSGREFTHASFQGLRNNAPPGNMPISYFVDVVFCVSTLKGYRREKHQSN